MYIAQGKSRHGKGNWNTTSLFLHNRHVNRLSDPSRDLKKKMISDD